MRNRRNQPVQAPQKAPAPDSPAIPVEEPQEAPLDVQEPETDEPYVSPSVLAAQSGEQVEFGASIENEPTTPTEE